MKILGLPQVEFDEFPTDETTKVCIFTRPRYPVPDLRELQKTGKKIWLFFTETAYLTMARLAKLPGELLALLPSGDQWLTLNSGNVNDLDTAFKVACLPTGSASGSVMLFIRLLDRPAGIILYTGSFKEYREVLISDLFLKFRTIITDIYVDNTIAGSKITRTSSHLACAQITAVIKKHPDFGIYLQMDMFDSLDLLIDLAQRHHLNIKLAPIQQLFIYKTVYKHLFEYDPEVIVRAKDLNKNYKFKEQPKITVAYIETSYDIDTYKRLFMNERKIFMRLIACEQERSDSKTPHVGLIYITYSSHPVHYDLFNILHAIKPRRVHPLVEYELNHNFASKIPNEILPENCQIINNFQLAQPTHEVTLDDLTCSTKNRSFLEATTLVSNTDIFEDVSDINQDMLASNAPNGLKEVPNGVDQVCEVMEISDDESVSEQALVKSKRKKRKRAPPAVLACRPLEKNNNIALSYANPIRTRAKSLNDICVENRANAMQCSSQSSDCDTDGSDIEYKVVFPQ